MDTPIPKLTNEERDSLLLQLTDAVIAIAKSSPAYYDIAKDIERRSKDLKFKEQNEEAYNEWQKAMPGYGTYYAFMAGVKHGRQTAL